MAANPTLNPEEKQAPASKVISSNYKGPGRLGDPNLKFFQEPRAHPKLVETFAAFGMDGSQPNPFASMKWDDLCSSTQMAKNHADTMKLYEMLPNDLPEDDMEPELEQLTTRFQSFDGTERTLYIFRRVDLSSEAPAILYFHGGGMTILDTANKVHFRWCKSLAAHGLIVIAVDFRNAWTPKEANPFPIGLKDCTSAFHHISQRKSDLRISKILLQGESGGANLALATALKAKKEGWVHQVAGVYAAIPYISNAYGWSDARKLKELPSLYECEGYWLHTAMMAGMSHFYSGGGETAENSLAWPYFASVEECVGLPPHALSMDELDPLRDEGMAYYRKLLAAGVQVTAKVNLGMVHGSGILFRKLLPEMYEGAVRDVVGFARRV